MKNPLAYSNLEFDFRESILFSLFTALFMFLFFIIFQPFGVNNYDPNEELRESFIYGISIFSASAFVAIAINELLFRNFFNQLNSFLWFIWSCFWLSLTMYLVYNWLGGWHDFGFLSFLDFTKNVSILYLIPFISLVIYTKIRDLNQTLNYYYHYDSKLGEGEKILHFKSENSNESLSLRLDALLFIRSEDNYVSVFYLINGQAKRELLRGTLKSIMEENIQPSLFRSHRSYIVNLYHLLQLKGNMNKMEIFLKNYKEPIPVSRKYIDGLREFVHEQTLPSTPNS